jgi:hypothetical protein
MTYDVVLVRATICFCSAKKHDAQANVGSEKDEEGTEGGVEATCKAKRGGPAKRQEWGHDPTGARPYYRECAAAEPFVPFHVTEVLSMNGRRDDESIADK